MMIKWLKTFVLAVAGGVCVSIAGAAFLSADNKVVGTVFFSLGLFVICTFGFNLYTGKVCYLFNNKPAYIIDLLIIWAGNLAGAWLTAAALHMTRLLDLTARAAALCSVKLGDGLLSVFILAVFCNILIYIGVEGFKSNPHELGKYMSLLFGVTVFSICGFEHSVADMFFISVAGMWSGRAFLFILVVTLGNAVGGVLLPLVKKLQNLEPHTYSRS